MGSRASESFKRTPNIEKKVICTSIKIDFKKAKSKLNTIKQENYEKIRLEFSKYAEKKILEKNFNHMIWD